MTTPIAGLPEISENQANKAITHNQSLRQLEINFGAVISRLLTAPPVSPADGDLYIPATGASGAWLGQQNKLLQWTNGGWHIYNPFQYQRVWSIADSAYLIYVGSSWSVITGSGDMTKSAYDTNDDNKVNAADTADVIAGNPTAGQYYGTPAGSTTKGFYDLPSAGGGGDMSKNVYDPDDDGVVVAAEVATEIAGTPGNNQYYGTNSSGVKGFHDLPLVAGLGAYVVNTNPQNLVANQLTTVNFNSAITNTGGFWSPQNPTRLTIPITGLYLVSFQCRINGNVTATQIAPFLWANNSFTIAADQRSMTNQLAPDLFIFAIFRFNQSDYIEPRIWLQSTASYTIFNSTNTEPFRCSFSIARFP